MPINKNSVISIVIVNWNSGDQLLTCLKSISEHHDDLPIETIVVDNGSVDDSVARISHLPNVTLVLAETNLGFGKACNLGAKNATGEFILFLNPDAALYAGTLKACLSFMRRPENEKVGICGVQLLDERQHIARSCARFPSPLGFLSHSLGVDRVIPKLGHPMVEWDHNSSRAVDQVIGAFFFVRGVVFRMLDGFDERFFVYYEEVDFSYRARQAGWSSVYLAEAQAFHAGGGTSRQIMGRRLFYSLRSRLQYGFKHFSPTKAWLLVAVSTILEPGSRSAFSLLRGRMKDVRNTLEGYSMLWKSLPAICRERK